MESLEFPSNPLYRFAIGWAVGWSYEPPANSNARQTLIISLNRIQRRLWITAAATIITTAAMIPPINGQFVGVGITAGVCCMISIV